MKFYISPVIKWAYERAYERTYERIYDLTAGFSIIY
jgi:hypothetical protein